MGVRELIFKDQVGGGGGDGRGGDSNGGKRAGDGDNDTAMMVELVMMRVVVRFERLMPRWLISL